MRLVRFDHNGRVSYGRLEGDGVRPLAGPPWQGLEALGPALPLAAVRLLAPVLPSKIIAVGLNYRDHARESGMKPPDEPLIFSKAVSALIGPGQPVRLPGWAGRVDYEAELAVVIGRKAKNLPQDRAAEAILGLTCLNDVTARQLQRQDGQFTRAKGFDTFCPLGPWIETDLDSTDLAVRAELNGRLVQEGRTRDMIFSVEALISHITRVMTLHPGDVIATGTPAGVGPLSAGDEIVVEVENVGHLANPVTADELTD
ncbi:MAG: fumarylacetoacetate hydrolase family protein [Deltaproteobacteria bacterium]|nr:fumarylacetoacetate hydrolase family protein [Deltaproteobacteria bacterium]